MATWFIIWFAWNILSLWLAFSAIEATLSWHKNKHTRQNALLQLLRFPVSYLVVYITGYVLFRSEKSSLEDLALGPLLPLLTAYFLVIAQKLICSIQPGKSEEISRWRLDELDVISSFKKQREWWTLVAISPKPRKSDKEARVDMKRLTDSFHDKV